MISKNGGAGENGTPTPGVVHPSLSWPFPPQCSVWSGLFILCLCVGLAIWHDLAWAQGTEADVYVNQAILSYEDKRYDEALQQLADALKLEPNHIEALYYTGVVLNGKQQHGAAIQVLTKAKGLNPSDPAISYQLGLAYFSLQQYEQAQPLLEEVFTVRPKTENVGYYVGFMRYRQKDYQGAVKAFSSGTSTDPQFQQLNRFYSGLALAILGLPEQAAGELEEATRIRTVSPLTGPADRLRETVLASQQPDRRLHAEIRVGAFYDSNVSVNPLSSQDPLVLDLRSRKTNTPGELFSARAEYSYFKSGPWEATVLGSYFHTFNNDLSFFNIENYLGGTGLSYQGTVASLPFQVATQYTFDSTTLSGSRFMNRHSVSAVGTLVESGMHLTSLIGRFQKKDFSDLFLIGGGGRAEENRDPDNYMIGVTHVLRFANDRHFLRFGYQYDMDDAKGGDWFYRGHRFLVGTQYTLPWQDIRLKYDFDFHYRRYTHPNAVFPTSAPNSVRQEVKEQNHIARIEWPVPKTYLTGALPDKYAGGFVVAADFQATISRANLPYIFQYNRYVSTVSLAWGF